MLQLFNKLLLKLLRHLILFLIIAVRVLELHAEVVQDSNLRIMFVHVLHVRNQAIKVNMHWLNEMVLINMMIMVNMMVDVVDLVLMDVVIMVIVLYMMVMLENVLMHKVVIEIKSINFFLKIEVPVDVTIPRHSVMLALVAPGGWNRRLDELNSTWYRMPFLF